MIRASGFLASYLCCAALLGAMPSDQARDAQAKAYARRLQRCLVRTYLKAQRAGIEVQNGSELYTVMTTRVSPMPGPTCPLLGEAENPWKGIDGAPDSAIQQGVGDIVSVDRSTAEALTSEGLLGLATGAFKGRDPIAGTEAAVATAVYLHDPVHPGSSTHVFTLIHRFDESAKDRAARALALKVHRQIRIRVRRVRAAGLEMNGVGDFQADVFGRGPGSTEIPAYWTAQNPWHRRTPALYTSVWPESSSDGGDTIQTAITNLGQIRVGYRPATPDSPALVVTAVYLLKPFPDGKGGSTHVFSQVSRFP